MNGWDSGVTSIVEMSYNWLIYGVVGNFVCRTWLFYGVIHDGIASYAHFHNVFCKPGLNFVFLQVSSQ